MEVLGSQTIIYCIKSNLYGCIERYNKGYIDEIHTPNMNNRTPFIVACSIGNLDIVKWLYEKNVNIYHKDKSGISGVLAACREGNLDVIKYLYEINGLTQITDSDNLDQHSLWFICNHSYIDLNKRLLIAKFLIRKNVITGTSGNIKNDMIVNDIHKYIFDPKFKEEIKLWAENEIKKNKNLFLLFNILNKYDNKLKDLFRTIIDFDNYIYSHEIKNIKRFNLNIT